MWAQAPREREGDNAQHLADKYRTSRDEALTMHQRMTDVAASEGLDFRFDLARGGNTFDAHRLLHLAEAYGLQDALKERLMRASLTEGVVIGAPAALESVAVEVGLPEDEVRDVLATERYAEEVRDDERTGSSLGISAVPFFVVDRKFGASGAQPPEALEQLLRHAWAQSRPAIEVVADGAACGPDGC